jgi:hypothetical protein
VHTFLASVDPMGAPRGAATEVPLPWPIADAVWNGSGYHLALLYPGGDGVRLSMVTTSETGQPREHPDWASGAGFVRDVHLVARGQAVRAVYLGGPGGDRVLESDVTTIRSWGTEPPSPTLHGRTADDCIAVASDGRWLSSASAPASVR